MIVVEERVVIETICPLCRKVALIEMTKDQFNRIKKGELIQNILPDMKPEEREMLISGICPDCWTGLFG